MEIAEAFWVYRCGCAGVCVCEWIKLQPGAPFTEIVCHLPSESVLHPNMQIRTCLTSNFKIDIAFERWNKTGVLNMYTIYSGTVNVTLPHIFVFQTLPVPWKMEMWTFFSPSIPLYFCYFRRHRKLKVLVSTVLQIFVLRYTDEKKL